ncbi:amidohydrolase family protein [Candidatus Daviesbacteria bacterium]|nr:amidohydrolase family protein [Candidatus Daviesbacteria bacterium]
MFDPKQIILDKIKTNGGWVNTHAHLDRAYTVDEKLYKLANAYRHEKWKLNSGVRRNSTIAQIYDRMAKATELMIAQGVSAIGTFIDVDPDTKDKAIKAAQKLKDRYKSSITFKFINLPSYGILPKESRFWFEVGAEFADIIGSNMKTDQGREVEHLEIILQTAKDKKKMVHIHVDELNLPGEFETELLAKKTIEYKMEGKVVGIHGISINAHPKKYREELYKLMKKAKLMMIACPMSWINSRRSEEPSPIHNPSTPVDELLPYGILVALGTDNIADLMMPYNDGILWNDLRALMEMNRLYDIDELVKIATVNGREVLGIN